MRKKIRIVSPAKAISAALIDAAATFLEKHGHTVTIGKHAKGTHHYFSGKLAERLTDFQKAIDDKDIDIILCARGGYGCIQIIDDLDFSSLKDRHKQIVGFSDITVFHSHCHRLGIKTVHASMPLNFENNTIESLNSLLNAIENKPNTYEVAASPQNRNGKAEAEIIGGNLAIIHTLIGTNSDCNFDHKILFIEDVGEYVYTIDRMLWALARAGKLKKLAGLIVGGMTNIKDTEVPFGGDLETVIFAHVAPFDFPVCFNFPAGHVEDNRALTLGKKSVFEVSDDGVLVVN